MKKTAISAALAAMAFGVASNASANLAPDAALLMGAQSFTCPYDLGTPPDCVAGAPVPQSNFFAMDNDGSGVWEDAERVALDPGTDGGIVLGATQGFGTSTGTGPTLVITAPGGIDAGWGFFGSAGWHTQAGTLAVATDDGAGSVTLDMTGWNVHWNDGDIDMGQGAAAVVSCGVDCAVGDTFTMDYDAVVPSGSFIGVAYQLHLSGTIGEASVIPVPAAVWLFGSGMLGLVGVARRKKQA